MPETEFERNALLVWDGLGLATEADRTNWGGGWFSVPRGGLGAVDDHKSGGTGLVATGGCCGCITSGG